MILDSIIIENIRSYEHEEIEFPKGTTLFEGDIGSGKSTILMAIEFALFGTGSQSGDSLLSKKAKSGYVILDFTVDNDEYQIKRSLKRTTSKSESEKDSVSSDSSTEKSWIVENKVKRNLTATDLKKRVLEILKFNEIVSAHAESRIYRYAVFTPQEAMKDILSDETRRLDTIRRAFVNDNYKLALENAKNVISDLNVKIKVKEQFIKNEVTVNEEIENLKENIKNNTREKDELEKRNKVNEEKKVKKELELKSLEDKEKEINHNGRELKGIKENNSISYESVNNLDKDIKIKGEYIDAEEKQLKALEKIEEPQTKYTLDEIKLKIKEYEESEKQETKNNSKKQVIEDNIENLKNKLQKLTYSEEIDIINLKNNLEDLKNKLEDLKNKSKNNDGEIEKKVSEKNQIEFKIQSIDEKIKKFNELKETCPTCQQNISKEHHESLIDNENQEKNKCEESKSKISESLGKLETVKGDLETELGKINEKVSILEHNIPIIEDINRKKLEVEIIIKSTPNFIEKNEEFGDEPKKYLTDLKEKIENYKRRKDDEQSINKRINGFRKEKLEKQDLKQQTLNKIKENEAKILEIQNFLEKNPSVSDEIIQKKEQVMSIIKEIQVDAKKIGGIESDLKNDKIRLEEKNSEYEKIIEHKKEYQKIKEIVIWLKEFFIPSVNVIEKEVLKSISLKFNDEYIKWYKMLIEDSTKASRIDESFTPIVEQDGYIQEISYLSGGEKTSVALAYRLALNSIMRKETETLKSNLLILDEPTDGFSKEQLNKMKDIFHKLESKQIILVSHDRELEASAENIFEVTKENGVSKIYKKENLGSV